MSMNLRTNKDGDFLLVYYGWTNPDADTQRPLFRELAKRAAFLYVSEPEPFRKLARRRSRLAERGDGIFYLEPVSVLPFGRKPEILRLNYMRGGLARALKKFPGCAPVAMACRPKMHVLKGLVSEKAFVYDCYDDYVFFKNDRKEQQRVRAEEAKMLSVADAAFCTADTLVEKCRAFNPKAYKVPLGVDFNLFKNPSGREPEDISAIPRPRIGTIGKFNRRVDLNLIAAVAKARPKWAIGRCSRRTRNSIQRSKNS